MREKRLTTEPPVLTEEGFEDSLATDNLLVDYFNEFLSLPTFSEAIRFNVDYGVFEVVNDAPQLLEKQLKRILHEQKPRNPIYDVIRKEKCGITPDKLNGSTKEDTIKINYNIMSLNREQGIQWIKKERLPAFLESDCYFEYRLAKLISQVRWSRSGMNMNVDSLYRPWVTKKPATPPPSIVEDENELIMKKYYISLGQATVTQTRDWFTMAKQSQHTVTTFSSPTCLVSPRIQEKALEGDYIFDESMKTDSSTAPGSSLETLDQEGSVSVRDTPSHALLRIYLERKQETVKDLEVFFPTFEGFVSAYINFIMKSSVAKLAQRPFRDNEEDINFNNVAQVVIQDQKEDVERKISEFSAEIKEKELDENLELVSLCSRTDSIGSLARADWCVSHKTYDIGTRKEFERFKKFIKGTLGERYRWLWMDIERLKVLKDPGRRQRHLEKMRKCYLVSSGECYLTPEVLLKLNLIDGSFWNEPHLRCIQSEVVKPLLQYWGPRFCVTHKFEIKNASAELKFWHSRQERPRKDIDPFPQMATLLPLRPKSCMPQIPTLKKEEFIQPRSLKSARKSARKSERAGSATRKSTVKNEAPEETSEQDIIGKNAKCMTVSSKVIRLTSFTDISECLKPQLDRKFSYTEETTVKKVTANAALFGSDMENLLQSLYVESRAGFFFTKFCECSGNKLWKNSAYFWFDLQAYHQLFYQETLQPFKVCKQAQYLYAMYVAPSASLDIGLEKKKKKEIYMKIDPPFEDLFDAAEEYILLLLLEPWIQMVKSDQNNYGQVELVKQDRQLDSLYFRKLQAIHKETVPKKEEEAVPDLPVPYIPKETQLWNKVPEEFRHLNFNYLVNNKLEFEHFRQFLASHSASMDLMCWTDIEQFRRILHQDQKQREAKSIDIKNKYLNKKYFFGPNSPATKEQQDEIMQLGGGWGMILHEQLASPVLLEIQKCVRRRLENMWLPLFLSSEQYAARQKIKLQMEDIAEDFILKKRGEKIGVWKASRRPSLGIGSRSSKKYATGFRSEPEDSKWIASSADIIAFRKALLNPLIAKLFQRFVSLKGDLLGNGVLFWQEVQKYKDLCHSHCEDAVIQNKITTIINCFINSSIPPALQIDLPFDQAQKIIEHRKELGPYVFREAQMTIFGVLFKYWPQFCQFRSNLTDEKAVTTLERRKEFKKKQATSTEDSKGKLQDASRTPSGSGSGSGRIGSATGLNAQGYNRQPSWCYSKYIEALEQERTLLKIQEDLEKKITMSNLAGPSLTSGKTFVSSTLNMNVTKCKFLQEEKG
ncbi:regulator of G-protein signaling 22 [Dromiciops gliroides]|uniref:regulator of G-protein signaling 22 n=1 Tax=Dromiciops gliroides TaxID=33562 RepID=UPI001CC752F8|nr:regulator of G-protein signaling 22 [Dromiciops gliroides]